MAEDYAYGPVDSFDQCPEDDQCSHCAAGRPSAPVEVGDPRDLDTAVAYIDHEEMRFAMPPAYHRPIYIDVFRPPRWFCASCWDSSQVSGWPCKVAERHGKYLARAQRLELTAARKLELTAGPAR